MSMCPEQEQCNRLISETAGFFTPQYDQHVPKGCMKFGTCCCNLKDEAQPLLCAPGLRLSSNTQALSSKL